MLPCLIAISSSLEFQLYGRELTISGHGSITQDEVKSNCDPKAVLNIIIEDGITSIETLSFYYFEILESIRIPKTVQKIVSDSTRYCFHLYEFILDPGNDYLSVDSQGALFDNQKTTLIRLPPQRGPFTIPNTVVKIEVQALQGCLKLSKLTIPSSVETLSFGMIYDSNINFVTFQPNSKVQTIVQLTFGYSPLEKIFIPKSVITIDLDAFYSSRLTTVIFKENSKLDTIKNFAFRNCNLYNFSFPSGTKTIENDIFT